MEPHTQRRRTLLRFNVQYTKLPLNTTYTYTYTYIYIYAYIYICIYICIWKQTRARTPPHHPRPENLFEEWKVRTLAERFPLQPNDAKDDELLHSIRHKLDSWDSFQERERCFLLTPGNQVKEATYHKSVIRNIPW